jgi:hypothetical protein
MCDTKYSQRRRDSTKIITTKIQLIWCTSLNTATNQFDIQTSSQSKCLDHGIYRYIAQTCHLNLLDITTVINHFHNVHACTFHLGKINLNTN